MRWSLAFGLVDLATAGLFLLVAYGYAILAALAVGFSFHRCPR